MSGTTPNWATEYAFQLFHYLTQFCKTEGRDDDIVFVKDAVADTFRKMAGLDCTWYDTLLEDVADELDRNGEVEASHEGKAGTHKASDSVE